MIKMVLYPYQQRVKDLVQQGRSVILQAPTGAGKTRAALAPFIEAFFDFQPDEFPKKCLYSVPMRVLANQFNHEYRELAASYLRRHKKELRVKIQTGEFSEDPKLEGDLIFSTIDQTLSNFLCVPYALGLRSANLNAGGVIGSYLVFDEFHLFPHGESNRSLGAMKTTLQMLQMLKGITPFILMTATFSSKMLADLQSELHAEVVTLSAEELAQIPSQRQKQRRYQVIPEPLTAEAVWRHHQRRSIAICNTVERAQNLFTALLEHPDRREDTEILLLHSRFTQEHRQKKEERVHQEFGKEKDQWKASSMILVATQVIEVGLDITCEVLHTETAPANAIFQRAGRCARFEGEKGEVYIYDVPQKADGQPNDAPYLGVESEMCRLAWQAFQERQGAVLDFLDEQEVIDQVHSKADQRVLQSLHERRGELYALIQRAIQANDPATRRELIRDTGSSRTIFVHEHPEELKNPFQVRGFSFHVGTLIGKYRELEAWADENEIEWLFKFPKEVPEADEEDEEAQESNYLWYPVSSDEDLKYFPVLAVNPTLVAYDEALGLRFQVNGRAEIVASAQTLSSRRTRSAYSYQLEDYATHIGKMTSFFQQHCLPQLEYALHRLEEREGWSKGSLELAARLVLAMHDVGKMDQRWQRWAQKYQKALGEPVKDASFVIAHTRSENEAHRQISRSIRPGRPKHAGEGAIAVAKILDASFPSQERSALRKIAMTAIARHHSPQTDRFDPSFQLVPAAPAALQQALQRAGVKLEDKVVDRLLSKAPNCALDHYILSGEDEDSWWLAYLLLVRALRLSDGGSQEVE